MNKSDELRVLRYLAGAVVTNLKEKQIIAAVREKVKVGHFPFSAIKMVKKILRKQVA